MFEHRTGAVASGLGASQVVGSVCNALFALQIVTTADATSSAKLAHAASFDHFNKPLIIEPLATLAVSKQV